MAKKPGSKAFKNRSGNPAARGTASSVASLGVVRAQRALSDVVPAFTAWALEEFGPEEDIQILLGDLKAFFSMCGTFPGTVSATDLDPEAASAALELVREATPEAAEDLGQSLHDYVHFLIASERWTGSTENLNRLHEVAERASAGAPPLLPPVVVPDLAPDAAWQLVQDVPLWQRTVALLQWIGAGQAVTDTGVLRRKDIAAAAACVGINAVGTATRTPWRDDEPVPVTSMLQLPWLMTYWEAMLSAGLIEVTATKVRPTARAAAVRADPAVGLATAQAMAAMVYADVIYNNPDWVPADLLEPMTTALFTAASQNTPPPTQEVLATLDDAAGNDMASRIIRARLQQWANHGLLTVGEHIVVPPVLREPLSAALGGVLPEAPLAEDDPDSLHVQSSEAKYQLKIQVDGIKPPVWRRIEVPAAIHLDDLHRVIQTIFRWEDYHLHEFRLGGRDGASYAPYDPDADHWGEPPVDESTVKLSTLLAAPKDTLAYNYDFGDDWDHTITLEKVLPASAKVARCTGGRGLAPQEDSGGSWGWMDKVDAANDPEHSEHEAYREWLGLADGEPLDPAVFDRGEVESRLAALRLRR
ncbi:plasmid pRiA4b ORF-3 family protein [Arthrobacter sp. 35W]|uniref:plasmid pRiA4b ORF-3 family protein n=1 Tax=Arthrobacter sp. 35W TaxID=1132441 RepID=UPI00040488E7|nr:plasmid pRiA4b ORF-3 family protein [Arthrobacter sp. 35W]